MMTLQSQTQEDLSEAQTGLQCLAPTLAGTAAETAGAFFCSEAAVPGVRGLVPRFTDFNTMRCSQKNVGERFEMICNLAVDKDQWDRLFTAGESEELRRDAFCELANCICGAVMARPEFSGKFGYLVPCVPCSGPALVPAATPKLTGAIQMGNAWILYSFSVLKAAGALPSGERAVAAA